MLIYCIAPYEVLSGIDLSEIMVPIYKLTDIAVQDTLSISCTASGIYQR